jgi:hypothetical protein
VASGQIYILDALLQEKKPTVPFKMDVRWAQQPVRTVWRTEKFLTPGVQHLAQSVHRHTEYGVAVSRLRRKHNGASYTDVFRKNVDLVFEQTHIPPKFTTNTK